MCEIASRRGARSDGPDACHWPADEAPGDVAGAVILSRLLALREHWSAQAETCAQVRGLVEVVPGVESREQDHRQGRQ
jgi:hypothetical protein